jgi:hypothetical protein
MVHPASTAAAATMHAQLRHVVTTVPPRHTQTGKSFLVLFFKKEQGKKRDQARVNSSAGP